MTSCSIVRMIVSIMVVSVPFSLMSAGVSHAERITIETVPVGNPGNAGELSGKGAAGYGADRVCGRVGYHYNIGKYEVTNAQYAAFLNAVWGRTRVAGSPSMPMCPQVGNTPPRPT